MSRTAACLLSFALGIGPVWADAAPDELAFLRQSVQQLTSTVTELTTTVQSQQQRIVQLEGRSAAAIPAARPSATSNLSAFNPEIGVLADIVGQVSESGTDGEGNDKLSAREVELVFGHAIDPYSRLDVTATFSDVEEAGLEEAYITHWGLGEHARLRIGRFRPKVGKAAPLHRDSLDTVDEPLVVAQYLGAEGLSRTGVDVSGFLPVPWTAVTHELTAGMLEGGVGEGAGLFGEARRRPSFYAHLKNFWDITEASNAELGATSLAGSRDADSNYEVHALGLDATLVHHVTPTNKLKWQNEVYLQHRDESVTFADDGSSTSVSNAPWGLYSLLDYRLSPRFGVGGRFDYVEPIDLDSTVAARDADTAWSGYVSLYQSEFARWRLQYRHTDFAAGGDDNTVLVQGTVAIGVHKHQIQ
jgi:hypothetical protein